VLTDDIIAKSLREQDGQVENLQEQQIVDHDIMDYKHPDEHLLNDATLEESPNITKQDTLDGISFQNDALNATDDALGHSTPLDTSFNPLLGVAASSASPGINLSSYKNPGPKMSPTGVLPVTGAKMAYNALSRADESGLRDYSDTSDNSEDADDDTDTHAGVAAYAVYDRDDVDVENGGVRKGHGASARLDVSGDEDKRDDSDMSSDEEQLRPSDITDTQRVYADTQRDVFYFSICVFINAILLEGPLAAIEALLRSFIFLLCSAITLIASVVLYRKVCTELLWACLRESLLCVAAFFSLCVPGVSCVVYRSYLRDETKWRLHPVPTILGWVDARRFFVFTFGNGSFANNVQSQDGDSTTVAIVDANNDYHADMDDDYESVMTAQSSLETPPGRLKKTHSRRPARGKIKQWRGEKCLDSWQGDMRGLRSSYDAMLCVPRRVQWQIIRIVRGDDAVEVFMEPQ
jgi:hypothetical protein